MNLKQLFDDLSKELRKRYEPGVQARRSIGNHYRSQQSEDERGRNFLSALNRFYVELDEAPPAVREVLSEKFGLQWEGIEEIRERLLGKGDSNEGH